MESYTRDNAEYMKNSKTINLNGKLYSFDSPKIMGILNVTPDSFYAESRKQTEQDITERIETILREGGEIIDIGGCHHILRMLVYSTVPVFGDEV